MGYVYIVKNLTTGLKYIGCKYQKNNCNPCNFWKTYFTSSNSISNLIELYGIKDFKFKILYEDDNEYKILEEERRLIKKIISRLDYINLHVNFLVKTEEEYFINKEKQKIIASIIGKLSYEKKIGIFGLSEKDKFKIRSNAGKKAAKINKELGRAIFDPEIRQRQHETLRKKQVSAYYNPDTRKETSSKGGKKGYFSLEYFEKRGMTNEDRSKMQAELGRRGGPKNKGFKWYNDGKNVFKYTSKQQKELSFDDFLNANKNLNAGMLLKGNKIEN